MTDAVPALTTTGGRRRRSIGRATSLELAPLAAIARRSGVVGVSRLARRRRVPVELEHQPRRPDRLGSRLDPRQPAHPSRLFTWFLGPFSDFIDWALDSLTHQLEALPVVRVAARRRSCSSPERGAGSRRLVAACRDLCCRACSGCGSRRCETLSLMLVSVRSPWSSACRSASPPASTGGCTRVPAPGARRDADRPVDRVPRPGRAPLRHRAGAGRGGDRRLRAPAGRAADHARHPSGAAGDRRGGPHVRVVAPRSCSPRCSSRRPLPSIMTGINQTINMALGIIVIAALVGAGGLGQEALDTLRLRSPGRGLVVGLAIVALAVMLDRVSRSFIERRRAGPERSRRASAPTRWYARRPSPSLVAIVVGRPARLDRVPGRRGACTWADWVDDLVDWIRDHWGVRRSGSTTSSCATSTSASRRWLRRSVAWPVPSSAAGARPGSPSGAGGSRCSARSAVAMIGLVGLWSPALGTLVQVLIAVVLAMVIAVPVGVCRRAPAAGRAGDRPGARRAPDDPAADLRDPVRDDLRHRHRARRDHRVGALRDPAGDPRHGARRRVGAGGDGRGGDDVRGVDRAR